MRDWTKIAPYYSCKRRARKAAVRLHRRVDYLPYDCAAVGSGSRLSQMSLALAVARLASD